MLLSSKASCVFQNHTFLTAVTSPTTLSTRNARSSHSGFMASHDFPKASLGQTLLEHSSRHVPDQGAFLSRKPQQNNSLMAEELEIGKTYSVGWIGLLSICPFLGRISGKEDSLGRNRYNSWCLPELETQPHHPSRCLAALRAVWQIWVCSGVDKEVLSPQIASTSPLCSFRSSNTCSFTSRQQIQYWHITSISHYQGRIRNWHTHRT